MLIKASVVRAQGLCKSESFSARGLRVGRKPTLCVPGGLRNVPFNCRGEKEWQLKGGLTVEGADTSVISCSLGGFQLVRHMVTVEWS